MFPRAPLWLSASLDGWRYIRLFLDLIRLDSVIFGKLDVLCNRWRGLQVAMRHPFYVLVSFRLYKTRPV